MAWRVFRETRQALIHCGGFRPHGNVYKGAWNHAISFHHVTADWLEYQNSSKFLDWGHDT